MKKFNTAVALALVSICFVFCSYIETHYTRTAKVVAVNDSLITAEDQNGYLWDFEDDSLNVGDEIRLIMDTNHTDSNIFDDKVVDVKEIKTRKER